MKEYKHTQVGYVHVILYSAVILFMGYLTVIGSEPYALIGLIVMLVVLVFFATLTVKVGDGMITVQFGVGVIRKRIQLSDVESYAQVKNP